MSSIFAPSTNTGRFEVQSATLNMKAEEDLTKEINNKEALKEKEPSISSANSSSKRNEEFLRNDEGTPTKLGVEQNRFSQFEYDTIPRSPSVCDNRSEANTDVVLRPRGPVVSAVVTPKNTMGLKKSNSSTDLQKMRKGQGSKKKNENMILQLVVPSSNRNSTIDLNNQYLTARSLDDILENGHLKHRPHSFNSQQDFGMSKPNGSYLNHAYSTSDLKEYGSRESPEEYSVLATPTISIEQPTPPEQRRKAFRELLANVLSVFYALFNVTLGLAVYVSDIVDGPSQLSEIFSLVLVAMAFLYVLYLTVDIHIYMKKKHQYEKLLERNTPGAIEMKETADGHFHFNIPLPQAVTLTRDLEHHYCFRKDRHSSNFYLKIGAAGFCFGHLIHSGLIIGYQIIFLTSDEAGFYECASVATLVLDFLYPIYSFLLLFFIFKYSNVIINKYSLFARFGVMHCLSSSVCFWIWTIFRETLELLSFYDDNTNKTVTTPPTIDSGYVELPYASHLTSNSQRGVGILTDDIELSPRRFTPGCKIKDESLRSIYRDYSPYLYPFSVEYSILVVGILFLVWQNIGVCKEVEEEAREEDLTRQCKTPSGNKDNAESNVVIHADCHASSKGLFGGFIVLVITVISTILFFVAIYNDDGRNAEIGLTVNIITSLIILVSMTIAAVFAYIQITKLDINKSHHNLLDDILLFICIPAYFLHGIFSIIPAIMFANALGAVNICIEVFQVLLQTCFILDGLRRSSNTKELRKKTPGRELVTFLIVSNVALWVMQTFEVKSHGMHDDRYEFYGRELWTILGHMCLPLMMFYRFHASVCIGDIWKYSYEPPGH